MSELKEFNFKSINIIDNESNEVTFTTKGYIKDDSIIYFKWEDNTYKFIKGDSLLVQVNDSQYEFNANKKTLANIVNQGFSMNASIITDKLEISNNKIYIEYIMDFSSFKGKYIINLEWN